MELKEAEEKSLKESERLEKEIADVQELKVMTFLIPHPALSILFYLSYTVAVRFLFVLKELLWIRFRES